MLPSIHPRRPLRERLQPHLVFASASFLGVRMPRRTIEVVAVLKWFPSKSCGCVVGVSAFVHNCTPVVKSCEPQSPPRQHRKMPDQLCNHKSVFTGSACNEVKGVCQTRHRPCARQIRLSTCQPRHLQLESRALPSVVKQQG